jgi:hypothetical protein
MVPNKIGANLKINCITIFLNLEKKEELVKNLNYKNMIQILFINITTI